MRAFGRETGQPLWTETAGTRWPPMLVADRVLIALPDGIRAMRSATGVTLWNVAIEQPLSAPLASLGESVLVSIDGGELLALSVTDGRTVWRRSLGSTTRHPVATLDARLIAVTLVDGRVVALNGETGDILWERSLPGTLSPPATARDRVFVGSTNNFFYALDAESGDERWRWRTGGDVIGVAAAGERVYFASLDYILRAVNRDNGNQQWKAEMPTRPSAPPIAVGDVVLLPGVAPRLDGFVGKTGAVLGSYTAPAELQGPPAVDGNLQPFRVALVAFTRDGRVTALRPTRMMLPDPPLVPLLKLPGRELPAEKLSNPKSQRPTGK